MKEMGDQIDKKREGGKTKEEKNRREKLDL